MKRCKTHVLGVCLFFLATVPVFCQQSYFEVDVGQSSDKFGSQSAVSGAVIDINGQVTVLHAKPKSGGPAIVVGGEIREPTDTANHAKEYAIFGGPLWQFGNFSAGFSAQIHKIILPTANIDNQFLPRDSMELIDIPLHLKYVFGPDKHAFLEAVGAPEFGPRYHNPSSTNVLPHPNLDHAYFVRGSVGYIFSSRFYAKASYENRVFSFVQDVGNPNGYYNWHSSVVSGGVGVVF
jgi:hypothetical protein